MAVSAARAFGLYLRTLRNRAGLSLQEVEDLARNTPGPISKNYLSRCENGQLGLALAKMTVLCKIYGIPSDVVLERMELDLELEQIGGPDTEQMSYEKLIDLGVKSIEQGDYWPGYACYREAIPLAREATLSASYKDHEEQALIAAMNCATAAMRLSRNRFATYEFKRIEVADHLSPANSCFLLNRMANASRYAGNYRVARSYSDLALVKAKETGHHKYLADYQINRASIALDEEDAEMAIDLCKKAQPTYKLAGDYIGSAYALYLLGFAYILKERYKSARLALDTALEQTEQTNNHRLIGNIYLSLGKLDSKQGKQQAAADNWRSAKRCARRIENRLLLFQADLCLLEQAMEYNLHPQKRNALKRLSRLAPFLPQSIDEVQKYRLLTKK